MSESQRPATRAAADWLVGGGEMGELIRSLDWSASSIGPIENWPQSLRTALSICLSSRFPMAIWWGPGIIQFYNDGYRPFLGAKHPRSMGQRGDECWSEIWGVCGPLYRQVMTTAEATWSADLQLLMERNNYLEETYFTFSYSPIRGEASEVLGNLITVTETTERVLNERRLRTMRDLGALAMTGKTAEEALVLAGQALQVNAWDIPFALLYLVDGGRGTARLVAASGIRPGSRAGPLELDLAGDGAWPVGRVVASARSITLEDLAAIGDLPAQPWNDPPRSAIVQPLSVANEVAGVMVAGVSPRRCLDEAYRGFYDLVAAQIATALSNARAYEEQRERSEALAEIDRAKTAFFSNVSHEFRTPLTLMLGPVEEMLAKGQDAVLTEDRAQLMLVQRNGLRLLKLVNTLLDFSRIEAGRMQASFEPTDLAAATAELAANFRSACERAGLELVVACPPLSGPVYVDREMWEKIVLNLVSNAFKFTFKGRITVSLESAGDRVRLVVRDTGTGVPEEELPRMFERFHRVEGARGRSHEGSGIGLALVQELVNLHGGTIEVESVVGRGTAFTVTVPLGTAHLPAERVNAARAPHTGFRADAFVKEALQWLPGEPASGAKDSREGPRPRVLLADDNADLREYGERLLGEHYEVEAVADGKAALAAARARKPDLIVSDVMMPVLDGFGLIRELREDASLREVPVILLSARAGEESRLEGLGRGADDYIVKPFSARELLVRVGTLLRSAETRRQSLEQARRAAMLAAIVESSDDAIISKDLDSVIMSWNAGAQRLFGYTADEAIGQPVTMLMLPDQVNEEPGILARIRRGETIDHYETVRRRKDASLVDISLTVSPIIDDQGRVVGASKIARDITEHRRAMQALRDADRRKDEFLATLSHELRNPLAPIRNAVELLGAAQGDSELAAQARGILGRQVNHLVRLVDDLLELSRISRGTIALQKEEVDLADIVTNAVETSRPVIEAAGHTLEVRLPRQPVLLHADPVRMAQILTNLLNNAAKYMARGGRIQLTAEAAAHDVAISVRDNGIGIEPEMLPRVFDMFVQAADGAGQGGLGIGLSLARSLAGMHGGTIEGRSDGLGRGSEFIVRLPTLASSRVVPLPAADETAASAAARRAVSGS